MINKNTTILLISIDESRLSPNVEADRSAYALRKCGYNTDIVHFHGVQTANQMMQKIAKDYDAVGVAVRQPAYKGGFNNGSIVVQTIKEKYPNTSVCFCYSTTIFCLKYRCNFQTILVDYFH